MVATAEQIMEELATNWQGIKVPEGMRVEERFEYDWMGWKYIYKLKDDENLYSCMIEVVLSDRNGRKYQTYGCTRNKNFSNLKKAIEEIQNELKYKIEKHKTYEIRMEKELNKEKMNKEALNKAGLDVSYDMIKKGDKTVGYIKSGAITKTLHDITADQLVKILEILGQ